MSLFRFPWLRSFVRRHTKPMDIDQAYKWERKLAIVYAVIAWHAFGFVCYACYKGKSDWAKFHGVASQDDLNLSSAERWAKTLGVSDAKVYKISGFKVSEYEIVNGQRVNRQSAQETKDDAEEFHSSL